MIINHLKRLGWLIAPLLLLVTIAVLFFNRLLLSNLLLAKGDPFLYFYPYWEMAADSLRSGQIPLWNPNIFMGAPILANSQVGLFYPLNWLVWFTLPTPYAFSASAFIHVIIGCSGAYLAGRRGLNLTRPAALLAAVLFGLGGYFTAQIEHINQLQGMAWLPWFLVALSIWRSEEANWRSTTKLTVTMAALFAFQLLAGHMQAVLITLVFVFVWQLVHLISRSRQQHRGSTLNKRKTRYHLDALRDHFLPLIAAVLLGAMLTSVQLIPTLELIQHSSRQSGLQANEALSFSLHPLLLSRALLPNYGEPLFIEYVTVLPLTALLLAMIGAWFGRKRTGIVTLLVIAGLGLFMALGVFNPVNHLVVRLPVFNLFRVPARWLLLFALAAAWLAGAGLDELIRQVRQEQPQAENSNDLKKPLVFGIAILGGLILWAYISVPLATIIPVGAEAAVSWPPLTSLLAWLLELFLAVLLIILAVKVASLRAVLVFSLILMTTIALFAGTRNLSYNNPTTPEAFFDDRPPALRLQTDGICESKNDDCASAPGRFLSLSNIFFDVGDQAEIDTIYSDLISDLAQYDYTVAIKQKEIIAPNLPMIYGLSSVDGFGGGILPLRAYSEVTGLMLPDGATSSDGRLREHLTSIPEDRWLDLFNAEYMITDKVGDVWQNDVFFDLQIPTIISNESGSVGVGHIQPFEATELWLLAEGEPGSVDVTFVDGASRDIEYLKAEDNLLRVVWTLPGIPEEISLNPCADIEDSTADCRNSWELLSLALVDSRDGAFQPLVAGGYRLIHSGDVKIYQNLDVLPRVFLLDEWIYSSSATESLEIMQDPDFDPKRMAVLKGDGPEPTGSEGDGDAWIISYEPEKVVIGAKNYQNSLLILTDADYPGWKAIVDGIPMSIYEADVLFRGVFLPAGDHVVEFSFEPETYFTGRLFSFAGLLIWLLLAVAAFWPKQLPWDSSA